jgi:hypothetical protein
VQPAYGSGVAGCSSAWSSMPVGRRGRPEVCVARCRKVILMRSRDGTCAPGGSRSASGSSRSVVPATVSRARVSAVKTLVTEPISNTASVLARPAARISTASPATTATTTPARLAANRSAVCWARLPISVMPPSSAAGRQPSCRALPWVCGPTRASYKNPTLSPFKTARRHCLDKQAEKLGSPGIVVAARSWSPHTCLSDSHWRGCRCSGSINGHLRHRSVGRSSAENDGTGTEVA